MAGRGTLEVDVTTGVIELFWFGRENETKRGILSFPRPLK